MSKVREWIPVGGKMPEIMKDVLICSVTGEIYKAFQNLGGIWIMQNVGGLISWRYKNEESVAAWMPLPKVYKKGSREGWILTSKKLPKTDEPVLISTKDDVYISHVRSSESDMWWMRNKNEKGADSVYLHKSSVVALMPLPETFKAVV